MPDKKRNTDLTQESGISLPINPLLRELIESAREQTARSVNSGLVMMYWQIGKRIREDVLNNERAEYGKEIVQTLSRQLTAEYGKGFSNKGLWRMLQFAEVFENSEIVATLSRQLSWSHFTQLIPIEDRLKREFYAEMCRVERWSTRTLRHKIGHLLYERTAVAKKPDELIEQDITTLRDEDRLTPDMVFRDPYFLDFLGLSGRHVEKDVEDAILKELEASFLRWELTLPLSLAKNGSQLTTKITTSTCSFITGVCDALLLSS